MLDVRRDRHQPFDHARLRVDELEHRQRIPIARLRDPLRLLVRDRPPRSRQRCRIRPAQPVEFQHREARHVKAAPLPRSQTDQNGDGVGVQSPKRERKRRRRRIVQPLRVVDHEQERRVLRLCGQQAECPRADRKPIALCGRPYRKRPLERLALAIWKLADRPEQRATHIEQAAKQHGPLRLDANARTARIPPAPSTASPSRAVLPTPGSPETTSTPLRPWHASASNSRSRARSASRPTSTPPVYVSHQAPARLERPSGAPYASRNLRRDAAGSHPDGESPPIPAKLNHQRGRDHQRADRTTTQSEL